MDISSLLHSARLFGENRHFFLTLILSCFATNPCDVKVQSGVSASKLDGKMRRRKKKFAGRKEAGRTETIHNPISK